MILLKIAGMYVGDFDEVNGKIKKLVLVESPDIAFDFTNYQNEKMVIIVNLNGEIVTGEKRFVQEHSETFEEYLAVDDEDDCDPVCDCRSCCGLD
ncbi:hypothetical protein SYYB1_1 [Bacillus phage vB_BaeroP_SYYB1]|uniref:Uncharacterized protein n=1 Tax=Bacillus phage vB_BaeroP_SYYB1 TaxID=2980552 RepID=A0A977SLX0_9CAUD|nr:hypothetical protein SYYB1_1 [Bacillus phage vB_BaeroP_SYYB1]